MHRVGAKVIACKFESFQDCSQQIFTTKVNKTRMVTEVFTPHPRIHTPSVLQCLRGCRLESFIVKAVTNDWGSP